MRATRAGRWLAVCILGSAGAFAGLASAASAPGGAPNVLLVTVDTLRPDALGWVAGRNETPEIDALARESFRFPGAVSPVPLTLPAHASLLTGLDPPRHGVHDNGQVLGPGPRTLGGALSARGYATGAVVSGYPLRALFGLDRGFDHYDDRLPVAGEEWRERPAPATTEAALSWARSAPRSRPWFLWVHYYDPHDPYTPPERLRRPGPRGAYDGEVALVDEAFGRLRAGIAGLPAPGGLLTVVTADHGESLGEHGEDTHGFFVYDSTLLVPLLVHFPGRVRPGESSAAVRLVDVVPTILELAAQPALPSLDGGSILPAIAGKARAHPPAYSESYQPWLSYGWAPLLAMRSAGWKLIDAPRRELYDLARDPGERDNRIAAAPGESKRLLDLLGKRRAPSIADSGAPPDPEVLEKLRSLGYVGGGGSPAAAIPAGLPDPKDRLRLKTRLAEAETALGQRSYRAALQAFDAVLAEEAGNRFALLRSAAALVALGRARDAVPRLERLLLQDPRHAEGRYALADALTRSGRTARAIQEWRDVTRLQPRRAAAWSNLGTVLLLSGRTAEAAEALGQASRLDPGDPAISENLAEARYRRAAEELAAGRTDAARKSLGEALAGDPRLAARARADPRLRVLLEE
jgi:arylsulfatase A-like enzyme/Flp pilus assembly protein TadD